ncbi:TetR/AcrR family transcriptional regulator [Janibacter indicus]|uniref:TetR/AcrR family transcriptional regulator n=1 Tax=Janibacter indicus TaxID=857417 RepID=UPI003D9A1D25
MDSIRLATEQRMVRPRYERGDLDARTRIAEAFWTLIGERPYHEVSVLELVRRAGVNKNTFYYHFANIDEMAATIVAQTLDNDAFTRMAASIDALGSEAVGPDDARLNQAFERLGLIAGNHSSPALRELLKNVISKSWCERYSINLEVASAEDRVSFEFALGGVLAVIGMRPSHTDDLTFRRILSFGLRDDVFQRLHAIARRTQTTA